MTTRRTVHSLAFALLLPLCSAPVAAADNLGAAFRPQGGDSAPGSGAEAEANVSGVRVVIVGAHRRVATIDGHVVRVGDRLNGSRVMRISLQEVVLLGEDGSTERLLVSPAVALSKRPSPANARDLKETRP